MASKYHGKQEEYMPAFKNMKDLQAHLQSKVNDALNNEVAETVKQVEQETVESAVYDAYTPSRYIRRGAYGGGLGDKANMVHTVSNGKLIVENVTPQNPGYRHGSYGTDKIAGMVEGGHSYDYWADAFPRPFTAETIQRLNQTDEVKTALVQGLKRNGINAK
jgi:hypothetical protein